MRYVVANQMLAVFTYRRHKMDSEGRIKQSGLTLLEMKCFLDMKKFEAEDTTTVMNQLLNLRNR